MKGGVQVSFAMLVIAALTGCQLLPSPEQPHPKVVVVFVDISSSVHGFAEYREAWARITDAEALHPGDRIVLGRISDATYTAFRPLADRAIPAYEAFREGQATYKRKLAKGRSGLDTAFNGALAGGRSPRTDIMSALLLAEQVFRGDQRRRVLVILSDMLEDSPHYNFERSRITEGFIKHVIHLKQQRGELPDLRGVRVYVAGASAASSEKALEVKRFWLDYFAAAHAELRPEDYGPALVNFDG